MFQIMTAKTENLGAIDVGVTRPTGGVMIGLSRYVFETLRKDERFAFCPGAGRMRATNLTIFLVAFLSPE
jgi:hypothetical protein